MAGGPLRASLKSVICAGGGRCYGVRRMSEPEPPPPPLGLILGIIIVADLVILAILGAGGMLARLSPGAQFYYGLTTFGFPVLVYWLLKRRRDKRD